MATTLFPTYNSHDLINGKASGRGYSFTFDTANPLALNLANGVHLLGGFRYDLTVLRTTTQPLNASPQVRTLYNASKTVDHLWIDIDQDSQEIIGSWPGDPV